jgi:hypothetical protein
MLRLNSSFRLWRILPVAIALWTGAAMGPLAASAMAAGPQINVTCPIPTAYNYGSCNVTGSGFTASGTVKLNEYAGTTLIASSSLQASNAYGEWVGGTTKCSPVWPHPCYHIGGTWVTSPGGTFSTSFSLEDHGLSCDASATGSVQLEDVSSGSVVSEPVTWVGPECTTTTGLSIPSLVNTGWTAAASNPAKVTSGGLAVTSGTVTITVNGAQFCSYPAGASTGCSLATLPVGTDQVSAQYSGPPAEPFYAPSSATATVTVMIASTSGLSPNWTGYVDTGDKYTAVSASWIVPKANCGNFPTGDLASSSAEWVGLDGSGNGTVEQIGTDTNCAAFSGVYWAWWEMYPGGPQVIGVPGVSWEVHPGDQMSASVVSNGQGAFTLKISDQTAGWTYSTVQSNPSATDQSAEWIAEQPAALGIPLTNYGSVTFTNCLATGSNGQATAIWDHTNEAVDEFSNGVQKGSVSPLSAGGMQFTATWLHG